MTSPASQGMAQHGHALNQVYPQVLRGDGGWRTPAYVSHERPGHGRSMSGDHYVTIFRARAQLLLPAFLLIAEKSPLTLVCTRLATRPEHPPFQGSPRMV